MKIYKKKAEVLSCFTRDYIEAVRIKIIKRNLTKLET